MRIVSLNVNHRTNAKLVPSALIEALVALEPDCLVLTEYVEPLPSLEVREALRVGGLSHFAVSEAENYVARRWANQVLMASRRPIRVLDQPTGALDAHARSNILVVETCGLVMTGLRAPVYVSTADWRRYWDWLAGVASGDLVLGDLNVDPWRGRPRDRSLTKLTDRGWTWAEPRGAWSYKGSGSESRLDHALYRGAINSVSARYEPEPFWSQYTDHAALVVEL